MDAASAPGTPPTGDHYFRPRPDLASRRRTIELVLPDLTTTLVTDRGVFAADRVDTGTRLLLTDAPPPAPGARHVVDLGCGYGPIARTLAHRAPQAHVWAVDVNERALALTRDNLAATATDHTVCLPEQVPDDLVVDLIWSNPPIRVGKAVLHAMLQTWLGRLAPDGRAVLVVQRHLGADSLARWLGAAGYAVQRLAARQGYRLLSVEPRP